MSAAPPSATARDDSPGDAPGTLASPTGAYRWPPLLVVLACGALALLVAAAVVLVRREHVPPRSEPLQVGVSVWAEPGESGDAAVARLDATVGRSQVLRIFFPGLPDPWPGAAGNANRPVVVSFKAAPTDISSGSLDSTLGAWFADAPRDHEIYWSYYHEPEDEIENGGFTSAQYRSAWTHLRALADAADNPRLKSTLILMSWSLKEASGRDWRDYYPGADVIDVLGWDAYNDGASSKRAADQRSYDEPEKIYGAAVEASRAAGKPFGFPEWGSLLLPGDDGAQRAAWIRASTEYFDAAGATFATYFNAPGKLDDYRLFDSPSILALNEAIIRSTPSAATTTQDAQSDAG